MAMIRLIHGAARELELYMDAQWLLWCGHAKRCDRDCRNRLDRIRLFPVSSLYA